MPPPTGRAGGICYWLKSDADRWIREHKELIERRFERGPIKKPRAKTNTSSARR